MSSTLWTEGGKLVENSDGLLVVCSRCPCCVSPREATVAWQHIKVTMDVDRTDVSSGGISTHYIGTLVQTYNRIPWVPGQSFNPDEFHLYEVDCCPCRWNIEGPGSTPGVQGEVRRVRPTSDDPFETSVSFQFWDYLNIQCKSSSTPGEDPVQAEVFFQSDIIPAVGIHSADLVTTVNGVAVDPDNTGPTGYFYDGAIYNISFPVGSSPCDASNTFLVTSSVHQPAVPPDLASIDSEISVKIEFY